MNTNYRKLLILFRVVTYVFVSLSTMIIWKLSKMFNPVLVSNPSSQNNLSQLYYISPLIQFHPNPSLLNRSQTIASRKVPTFSSKRSLESLSILPPSSSEISKGENSHNEINPKYSWYCVSSCNPPRNLWIHRHILLFDLESKSASLRNYELTQLPS